MGAESKVPVPSCHGLTCQSASTSASLSAKWGSCLPNRVKVILGEYAMRSSRMHSLKEKNHCVDVRPLNF